MAWIGYPRFFFLHFAKFLCFPKWLILTFNFLWKFPRFFHHQSIHPILHYSWVFVHSGVCDGLGHTPSFRYWFGLFDVDGVVSAGFSCLCFWPFLPKSSFGARAGVGGGKTISASAFRFWIAVPDERVPGVLFDEKITFVACAGGRVQVSVLVILKKR